MFVVYLVCLMITRLCQTPTLCTWPKTLSPEEAEAKWNGWAAVEKDHTDPDNEFYMCRIDNELHVRVKVKVQLNFRTTTERKNTLDVITSSEKNVGQERIDALTAKVGMNIDKMGGSEVNLAEFAQQQMKNAADPLHSGSDITALFRDVKALLPGADKDGDDDDDDDDTDKEAEAEDGADQNGKPKKKTNGGR